jgi:membrane-anchored protein YejM (alkaline phosphatase superfamily)
MDFLSHALRNILKFDYVYNPRGNIEEAKKYKHLSAWYGQSFMVDDRIFLDKGLEWIRGLGDQPFFIVLELQNSHYPYWCPEEEAKRFPESGLYGRYRNAIRCQDRLIRELILRVENLKISKKTLIVIFFDHGVRGIFPEIREKLLEDEDVPEYNKVNIKVPLLIYNKWLVPKTAYVDQLTSPVDLRPPILDLLRIDYDPKKFDGRSIYRDEINNGVVVTMGYNNQVAP